MKKDDYIEVLWARICDLRQLLHNYAEEHDRGESMGTEKVRKCDCIFCQKVRQADQWRVADEAVGGRVGSEVIAGKETPQQQSKGYSSHIRAGSSCPPLRSSSEYTRFTPVF